MRTVITYGAAAIVIALAVTSCASNSDRHYSSKASYSDDASTVTDSTSVITDATVRSLNSPARKMVRTAAVRARVNNLEQATTQLETLVYSFDGIVMESNLQNEVIENKEYPYQSDSIKKIQVYLPTSHLILKVPAQHLDSVLHSISTAAAFTNYRVLKQEDVTLKFLANSMKIEAGDKSLGEKFKPNDKRTLDATAYNDAKQDEVIDRKVQNLQMKEDVAYATLEVELFRGQQSDVQVVVDANAVTRAHFGSEIATALKQGTDLLRAFVIFAITCWPVWIGCFILWVLWKRSGVWTKVKGVGVPAPVAKS